MAAGIYLRLRGGIYHCRIRVPQKLRFALKKAEVVLSLRTGRFADAARAAREIRVGLDRIMSSLDNGLAPAEIEERVRAWIAGLAIEFGQQMAAHDGLSGIMMEQEIDMMGPEQGTEVDMLMKFVVAMELEKAKTALTRAAASVPSSPVIERLVSVAARQMRLEVVNGSLESKAFRQSVLRNLQVLVDAAIAMAHGEPIPDRIMSWMPRSAPVGAETRPREELINEGKAISALWDSFCDSKKVGGEWKANEIISAKSTLNLWIRVNQDKPLCEYTTLDVEKFRKVYRSLPSDYYHNKKWKRIYEEKGPVALSEGAKPAGTVLTNAKTWNKHLSRLNECWKWGAEKAQALPREFPSIHAGFFIKIPKNKASKRVQQELRGRFSQDQLEKIFSSPLFLGVRSKSRWKERGVVVFRDHRYWMVIIGFLHGMRREEPFILKVRHVKELRGIWYFDLLAEDIAPLLKDVGSPRMVPLHKDLIELGFLDARVHNRDPDVALFPEAVSYSELKRKGSPFGQWFLHFRRSLGIDDEKLDFHAARHTVVSGLLDKGVPKSHVEEICGHEGEERRSELSTYDHGRLLETLKLGIDKWSLPFEPANLIQAVLNSDRINPSAANPRLDDPAIVPKPRRNVSAKR